MKLASEQAIGELLIPWLESQHWDVFQEVSWGGGIYDVVAVRGNVVWSIELKVALSFDVIEQAFRRKAYCHYSSICVPFRSATWFKRRICEMHGVGILGLDGNKITVIDSPKLHRIKKDQTVFPQLRPEHKTWAKAGCQHGNRVTPFAITCRDMRELVSKSPGIDLKTLISTLDHHYGTDATARTCLLNLTQSRVIKNIEARRDGKLWRFYPLEEKK